MAVIIDHENNLTTRDVPHKKMRLDGRESYVARLPAGDYAIHYIDPNWREGYGGRDVEFLMDDGTIETVKGPFSAQGLFDHGKLKKLAETMGDPTAGRPATKIEVGKNLMQSYGLARGPKEVTYADPEWSTEPIRDRLRPEWDGLELAIHTRTGTQYTTVKDALKTKIDTGGSPPQGEVKDAMAKKIKKTT